MNMSNNPQWKTFQPPPDTLNQDSIIDFKNMTSNGMYQIFVYYLLF